MSHSMLQDATALLELFAESDWRECHVRSAGLELYIARFSGGSNPLRAGNIAPVVAEADTVVEAILAAHLGSFSAEVAPGDTVTAGQTLGWLQVLDEKRPVLAGLSGRVNEVLVEDGALVEHRQPLITIAAGVVQH